MRSFSNSVTPYTWFFSFLIFRGEQKEVAEEDGSRDMGGFREKKELIHGLESQERR